MSNINYYQENENIKLIEKNQKYWSYLYELRHIPTGLLYVGSRSTPKILKTFEDCYTDNYLGSSLRKEGPFSEKDTKANPQDYAKTVLKVFYDEDVNKAWKYEHGENGLIMTYWKMYGKEKVLNKHCKICNEDVWSTTGISFKGNYTHNKERRENIRNSKITNKTVICPYCMKNVNDATKNTWHFKNCKLNPNFKKVNKIKNKRNLKLIECPHCNKTGKGGSFTRSHFKNCKLNINRNDLTFDLKTHICNHCKKEGKGTLMFKWHFDNCKYNPDKILKLK